MFLSVRCFNPHTHEGCDVGKTFLFQILLVSIHTPTKGVTIETFLKILLTLVSIHTPTKGVTEQGKAIADIKTVFQSTHPRRV